MPYLFSPDDESGVRIGLFCSRGILVSLFTNMKTIAKFNKSDIIWRTRIQYVGPEFTRAKLPTRVALRLHDDDDRQPAFPP